MRIRKQFLTRAWLLCLLTCALSNLWGCDTILPKAPDSSWFTRVEALDGAEGIEHYTIAHARRSGKNLIFVAIDDGIQQMFTTELKAAVRDQTPSVRLEELAWRRFLPRFRGIYDEVIRIRYDATTRDALFRAIAFMEARRIPYDLLLLTHGMRNHLVLSKGWGLLRWRDVRKLEGKLGFLDLVYLQICEGARPDPTGPSFATDWHAAGARHVLAFPDLNRNFFFVDIFYDYYRGNNIADAYRKTSENMEFHLTRTWTYFLVMKNLDSRIREISGMPAGDYFLSAPPILSER